MMASRIIPCGPEFLNPEDQNMRKVALPMHAYRDSFAGGPNDEMDWISVDEEMYKDVAALLDSVNTCLDAAAVRRTEHAAETARALVSNSFALL
jgi:hypothetical protein